MRQWVVLAVTIVLALAISAEMALGLSVLRVGPDLALIVVALVAGSQAPEQAAGTGFAAGLLRDLLSASPAGTGAAAFALVAMGISIAGPRPGLGGYLTTVGAATLAVTFLHAVFAAVGGDTTSVSAVLRVALVGAAYNALLTPLLVPLLRRLSLAPEAV